MVTTFERLAKVIKGYIKPANWIERAFASVASALVPSYTNEDKGKVLTLAETTDGSTERFELVDEQTVRFTSHGDVHLASDSFRLPTGVAVVGKTAYVNITIEGVTTTLEGEFIEDTAVKLQAENDVMSIEMIFTGGSAGTVYASAAVPSTTGVTISAYMDVESVIIKPEWASGGSGGTGDVEVVTFTFGEDMSITADKTFEEIYQMVSDGKTVLSKISGQNSTGYMQEADTGRFEFVFIMAQIGETSTLSIARILYTTEQISLAAFELGG